MASLRSATPRLRSYFRDKYIPQICEVLQPHSLSHSGRGEKLGEARRFPELELRRSRMGKLEVNLG
jgi:hypothetical protein